MLSRIAPPVGCCLIALALTAMPSRSAPWAKPFAHERSVWQLAFSGDGKKLAALTAKGVLIWDAATGDLVRRLDTPRTGHLLDLSPRGDVLAVYSPPEITLWDVAAGKPRRVFELELDEPINAMYSARLRFSPDGKFLVIHGDSASAYLLELSQGQLVRRFGGQAEVCDVAFSGDGKQLALATCDPAVQVFDPVSGKRLRTLDPEKGRFAHSVCFGKENHRLAAGGWDRIAVSESAGTSVELFQAGMQSVNRLAFAAEDRLLVSRSQDGKIRVWDIAARRVLRTYPSAGYDWALAPDGRILAVAVGRTIRFWDVSTGEERFTGKARRED